jgi:hypothetical protein
MSSEKTMHVLFRREMRLCKKNNITFTEKAEFLYSTALHQYHNILIDFV